MWKDKSKSDTRLSPPWGGAQQRQQQDYSQQQQMQIDSTRHFVSERSKVHTAYIIEQEKSKRLGLILSVILLVSAMLIVVFSPQGKEVVSYWIGAALVIFSAGAAGYKRLWAKAPHIEVEAGEESA